VQLRSVETATQNRPYVVDSPGRSAALSGNCVDDERILQHHRNYLLIDWDLVRTVDDGITIAKARVGPIAQETFSVRPSLCGGSLPC
jgi:hypothetical protein